jgi:hypothetical protein
MALEISLRPLHRISFFVFIFLLVAPFAAYPQVTLTGAIQFSTNTSGAFSGNQSWNTYGGDPCWDLWLAHNPDASSPINGPSDEQAGIDIPLSVGNSYRFYTFGAPDLSISLNGLNLFFDGDNSTPGISVFGATNSSVFSPDYSTGTRTLAGEPVIGSGKSFYSSGAAVVVLTGYEWNSPETLDVGQSFAFIPGDAPDYFGSFTLQVWPAATVSLSQTGGPPGTEVTTAGSGFARSEKVAIYVNHISGSPLIVATADASGAFSASAREPQTPYGPIDLYAVGVTSGKLGAASFFVTAAMGVTPRTGVPGDTVSTTGLGFGAGEIVDIYWGQPRQLLGTAVANRQGTGSLKIAIPANAPRGFNAVIGVGETTQAIAYGEIKVE